MLNEQLLNKCDKVIRFSFYCLIYFLPISIALVEIFSCLALFAFFFKRGVIFSSELKNKSRKRNKISFLNKAKIFLHSYQPIKTYLNWPIAAYILLNALSVVFSQDLFLSLKGFFFKLLQGVFIYFIFIEGIVNKKHLKFFLFIFMISSFLITTNGLAQYFTGKGFVHGHTITMDSRIFSSFKHPNDFGSYLIIVTSVLLWLVYRLVFNKMNIKKDAIFANVFRNIDPFLIKTMAVLLLMFSISCLGLTFSRGAWIGFIIGILMFTLREKKMLIMFILVIVAFFTIFYPTMKASRNVSFLTDNVIVQNEEFKTAIGKRKKEIENIKKSNIEEEKPRLLTSKDYFNEWVKVFETRFHGMGRSYFWKEAIAIIKDYPLFGSGLNTYSKMGRKYTMGWGGYPHNCFIQMAAEIGTLGVILFFAVIFNLYKYVFINIKLINDKTLKYLLIGFSSGLVGFLIHGAMDTNLYSVQLANFFWLIMAVIVAIQRISLNETEKA